MAQLKMLKDKQSSKKNTVEDLAMDDSKPISEEINSDEGSSDKGSTKEQKGEGAGDFSNYAIPEDIISKLRARDINKLFPVQQATFRPMYKHKDIITQARTGTGKTLSFVLPIVSRMKKDGVPTDRGRVPSVLVMAPTRELACQISEDFQTVVDISVIKVSCFYGGSSYFPQEADIKRGIDVLVGTPGRLMDLSEKGTLTLNKVRHVVIDEADRMLEIGFKDHMDKILAFCMDQETKPQFSLFSATMPAWVQQVASKHMVKPKRINLVTCVNKTSATVNHLAIRCMRENRSEIIGDIVQQYSGKHGKAIVFTQTKVHANELSVSDFINQECQVLHGDIVQKQRELRLQGFRDGKFQCLVATDVAARGLDIPQIDLVVQCEPPKDVDDYIHRSGRTGRAGRVGTSVCLYNSKQEGMLKTVERQAGIKFERVSPPQPIQLIQSAASDAARCLEEVPSSVIPEFLAHARELMVKKSAEEVIAAALAHISGVTEIKKRSLLSTKEGFTAYQMTNTFEVRSPYYFWNALESKLGADFRSEISTMRLTADKKGCVIDVPSKFEDFIADTWQDQKHVTLAECVDLPELEQFRNDYNNNNRNGYSNRGSGNRGYSNRGYNSRGSSNSNYSNQSNRGSSSSNYGNQSNRGSGNSNYGNQSNRGSGNSNYGNQSNRGDGGYGNTNRGGFRSNDGNTNRGGFRSNDGNTNRGGFRSNDQSNGFNKRSAGFYNGGDSKRTKY